MDNASIHVSADIFGLLVALLDRHGIRLVRMPKYSPEYNPCELIWAQVCESCHHIDLLIRSLQSKRYLRDQRQGNHSFLHQILAGFATVSIENVRAYYRKCVRSF